MHAARVLLFSLLAFIAASATGADAAKGFKRHKLSGDAEIHFPKKWQLQSFPMPPAMGMPPGTGEYRVLHARHNRTAEQGDGAVRGPFERQHDRSD